MDPRACGRKAGARSGVRRLEPQRDAVHAVAQPGRLRAVLEHVPEMAPAAAAMHLVAYHEVGGVARGGDRVLERLPEARPAGVAVELGRGGEQRQVAARARKGPGALLVVE